MRELSLVYPGRIELYPPEEGNFLKNLERRNAQSEELERIVRGLLEGNGQKKDRQSQNRENKRRAEMQNMDFKTKFERDFRGAEQFCKRPNILVAGYSGSGKTSLIRTILGDGIVPAESIDNSRSVPDRIRLLRE